MSLAIAITFLSRLVLVGLFLPFSALDKLRNFDAAVDQAKNAVASPMLARGLILTGVFVEIVMSLGVLSGVADRLAALVLAGYCVVTAILWKQFWKASDFALKGPSAGRDIFWDFLKNLAVAGGFLMVTFGPNAAHVADFFADPLSSTRPYQVGALP